MTWLREHWRPVAVIALLAVAFAGGRFSAAAPEVHESDAITVVQQVWSSKLIQREETKARATFRTFRPDGTKATESEREDTHTIEREDTAGGSRTDGISVTERTVAPHRPDWRVGVLVGVNLQLRWQVGAHVERRIIGPLSAGIWALHTNGGPPAAGVSLSLEF